MSEATMLQVVDDTGATIGECEKLAAHQGEGRLHRAFSVFLFDLEGRLLLQRRAFSKYHFPGVWSNTCCGHPFPQEPAKDAAIRRVQEELGISPHELAEAGTVVYRHRDPQTGLVEHEFNHVFVGLFVDVPVPDPAEVHEVAVVTDDDLRFRQARDTFSAWFPDVLAVAMPVAATLRCRPV